MRTGAALRAGLIGGPSLVAAFVGATLVAACAGDETLAPVHEPDLGPRDPRSFACDGEVLGEYAAPVADLGVFEDMVPIDGGFALATRRGHEVVVVTALSRDLVPRWTVELPAARPWGGDGIVRLALDGPGRLFVAWVAPATDDVPQHVALAEITGEGEIAWQAPLEDTAIDRVLFMGSGRAGLGLVLQGVTADGAFRHPIILASTGGLPFARLDATATLPRGSRVEQAAMASDGSVVVAGERAMGESGEVLPFVASIARTGELSWRWTGTETFLNGNDVALARGRDDRWLLTHKQRGDAGGASFHAFVLDERGTATGASAIEVIGSYGGGAGVVAAVGRAEGGFVVSARTGLGFEWLLHLDASGREIHRELLDQGVLASVAREHPDGAVTLAGRFAQSTDDATICVWGADPSGEPTYRHDITGPGRASHLALVAEDGGLAVVAGSLGIEEDDVGTTFVRRVAADCHGR